MINLRLIGESSLRKDYEIPKGDNYYIVFSSLDVCVEGTEGVGVKRWNKINLELQITKEQYETLERMLKNSEAKEPLLRVEGSLEIFSSYNSYI